MSKRKLFRDHDVRAILDGTKTQFREVVKVPRWGKGREIEIDEYGLPSVFCPDVETHAWIPCPYANLKAFDGEGKMNPSYQPGDVLWVAECWAPCLGGPCEPGNPVLYRASVGDSRLMWRPSTQMPQWASRLKLITQEVRVERVQAISEADAIAEGVEDTVVVPGIVYGPHGDPIEPRNNCVSNRERFAYQWNKDHPGSWDGNDWVWCVIFEVQA